MSDVSEAEIANVCNALAGSLLSWHPGASPVTPHGGVSAPSGHVYDGSCAICRFSKRPEAFEVVIRAALTAAYAIRDSSLTTRLEAAEQRAYMAERRNLLKPGATEYATGLEARLEAAEGVIEAVKRWSISSVRFHADKELLDALANYSEVTKEGM